MSGFDALYARHEAALEDFWSRRANALSYSRELRLFGRPATLMSNDSRVLAAADYSEPLYSQAPPVEGAPPFEVRLLVGPPPVPLPPLPENLFAHIHYMGIGQWLAIQLGPWGHCQVDLARGEALAVLSTDLAAQPELVSRCLLNTIFNNLLTAAGLAMLHATGLARGGRALLLMAPHGSGKSTAALRLALAGFPLMSDSQVYLSQRDGVLELTGFPVGRVKLRRDMREDFPELHPLLTPEEVRGETKFNLNLRQLDPALVQAQAIRPSVIDLCLLTRHAQPETRLTPATPAEFIHTALQNSLHYDRPEAWGANVALIEQLAGSARCHHLVVGTDTHSLVAVMRALWAIDPAPKAINAD
ncbi:MAG: hypothetical protein ABI847_19980 [Anaerolineales bacterium]